MRSDHLNEKIVLSKGGPNWRVPTVIRDNNCNIIYNSRFFIPNKEEEVLCSQIFVLHSYIEAFLYIVKF